jgi:Na+-translocating ferredoxin:NAD+ oxidoreductase RnfD subunit
MSNSPQPTESGDARLPLEDLSYDGLESLPAIPPSVLADPHPSPTHIGLTLKLSHVKEGLCLAPMLLAGLAFYGPRVLIAVSLVLATALAATFVWRTVGQRGKSLRYLHATHLALLLSCLLPAQLAVFNVPLADATWTLLPAAGLLLVVSYYILGGVGSRLHPVAVTALLLLVAFPVITNPSSVLRRPFLFSGDLTNAQALSRAGAVEPFLLHSSFPMDAHAIKCDAPAARLTEFGRGNAAPDGNWVSLDSLLRDRLPPFEDLLLGGTPTPLGLASLACVLFSALLLRGITGVRLRLPLLAIASAVACFLCLRLPVVVTGNGPVYRWFAFREPGVTWETLLTFALYQVAAGPLVFVACFLATSGASCPTTRTGRWIYAVSLGALAAVCQLYISVPIGSLLALVVISLLAPGLSRMFRPKPLFA